MLPRDKKIMEDRPCLYLEKNKEKGGFEICAPAVDCSFNCSSCGWNPEERERRMKTGGWVFDENGVRHLLFKSAKPPEFA